MSIVDGAVGGCSRTMGDLTVGVILTLAVGQGEINNLAGATDGNGVEAAVSRNIMAVQAESHVYCRLPSAVVQRNIIGQVVIVCLGSAPSVLLVNL